MIIILTKSQVLEKCMKDYYDNMTFSNEIFLTTVLNNENELNEFIKLIDKNVKADIQYAYRVCDCEIPGFKGHRAIIGVDKNGNRYVVSIMPDYIMPQEYAYAISQNILMHLDTFHVIDKPVNNIYFYVFTKFNFFDNSDTVNTIELTNEKMANKIMRLNFFSLDCDKQKNSELGIILSDMNKLSYAEIQTPLLKKLFDQYKEDSLASFFIHKYFFESPVPNNIRHAVDMLYNNEPVSDVARKTNLGENEVFRFWEIIDGKI